MRLSPDIASFSIHAAAHGSTMASHGVAAALAKWAARDHEFSGPSLVAVENALFDILGCMIAGSDDPATLAVARAVEGFGEGKVFAFGAGRRLPAPWSAMVSGTAAHALDFDDNFAPAFTHATAVLAPALFSLADDERLSGRAVVDAYIVGLELQARIGRLLQPHHYQRGWHATATIGAIGTAGACAKMLGCGVAGILASMSIATSMAGGSKKQFGSMMKPVHAGLAAKNAVTAARMAQAGITGDMDPFGGVWGLSDLAGDGDDEAGSARALERLGDTLAIDTDGVLVKRYPCCGAAHRTLDGIEMLRDEDGFQLDAVERVETHLPEMALRNLSYERPANEMESRFSGTYCAARILISGKLSLTDMTQAGIADPEIQSWLPRISLHSYDDSLMTDGADFPVATRLFLKSGAMREVVVTRVKGSPENPLGQAEIERKFHDCCRWSGRSEAAETLAQLARSLAAAPRFSEVAAAIEMGLGPKNKNGEQKRRNQVTPSS
jgi:2-methylcitrate dehydratase PrpD